MDENSKIPATVAAEIYIKRQERTSHPDGHFDKGGRWYPDASERQDCCDGIRSPSRAWPYSYMVHCRTAEHVAHLTGADARELKREAKRIRAEMETQEA